MIVILYFGYGPIVVLCEFSDCTHSSSVIFVRVDSRNSNNK